MLTLAVVSVSVLVSSAFALFGVYRMMQNEEASRLLAYRQVILDDLTGRLMSTQRTVDLLAESLASAPASGSATLLDGAEAMNAEFVDQLVVSDASGSPLAAVSEGHSARPLPAAVLRSRPSTTGTVFVWESGRGKDPGRVWAVRAFSVRGGWRVLAVRMRASFVQALVNDVASGSQSRAAALCDSGGHVFAAGQSGPPLDLTRATFEPIGASAGALGGLWSSRAGQMNGYWARLPLATELGWRVVVAEPSTVALQHTRSALLPSALTLLVAALLSTIAAAAFARRLVEPLHEFERAGRSVAAGKLGDPIEVDRADELGRLADSFNAMVLRLNALQELSRLLARSANLDELLADTLSAVSRLLGPGVVPAVFLLDATGVWLRLAAIRGTASGPGDVRVPADGPAWPARALVGGEPLTFAGEPGESDGGEELRAVAGPVRSALAVPLVVAGDPIGVLVAMSEDEREFAEAEQGMLSTFCAQAAVAIENSRLFEEERSSRREAEALREVAEYLESPPDLQSALERVAAIAAELLGAECVSLTLATAPQLGIERLHSREFAAWDDVYEHLAGVGSLHRPQAVPAGTETPGGGREGALLLIPLVQGGARRGMLVLECPAAKDGFTDGQLMLGSTIGREISLALDNAYLLHQARSRAANLETIFRISQAVSSSLQSTVVLNRVLDVVQKIFSADAVSLMTIDPTKRRIVTAMARGVHDREMLYFETDPGEDLPGRVFESRTAEVFPDLEVIDTPLAELATSAALRSLLAVPLLARGRSTGVLSVFSAEPHAFDPEDVELLQTFATQAALAIDTAALYGREHRVATVLQSSILPDQLPNIAGLDISSVYRPTGQEAEIGGDYYDVFTAPDGRVVLAIADVAGKGVLAATKTSMIRYSLRGMVAAGLGPGGAMTELNRMVAEAGDPADIVTVWVGYLDIATGLLTYADGGHPPALVLQPGQGLLERLGPTGPVLGAIGGAGYREERLTLEPGGIVMLYTDGVTEARSGARFYGEERVQRVLLHGGTAGAVVDRLMASVDEFTGGIMRDDAAVLAVRRTPADG